MSKLFEVLAALADELDKNDYIKEADNVDNLIKKALTLNNSFVKISYIRRRGKKWVVLSRNGKVLGTHDSKEKAQKQLAAVEMAKARARKR